MRKRRRGGSTAEEVMAELAADPEYVRRRQEQESRLGEARVQPRAAQAPLLADLAETGFEVDDVWELLPRTDYYPAALPILVEHLHRSYPGKVIEGIARALAVKAAGFAWSTVVQEYRRASNSNAQEGLAVAISVLATAATETELIELIHDEGLGDSRILLIETLHEIGSPRASAVLESLAGDRVLGKEASGVMSRARKTRT